MRVWGLGFRVIISWIQALGFGGLVVCFSIFLGDVLEKRRGQGDKCTKFWGVCNPTKGRLRIQVGLIILKQPTNPRAGLAHKSLIMGASAFS